jgi:hypothetical protein
MDKTNSAEGRSNYYLWEGINEGNVSTASVISSLKTLIGLAKAEGYAVYISIPESLEDSDAISTFLITEGFA